MRGALAPERDVFLVGLQHLDFNASATTEEIRKINPGYSNAISRDVADRGNALAERIAAADGMPTASSVAKVLLMSSLSTAEIPLRGLTDGELVEALVDPVLEVSEIKAALTQLQGQAWYLYIGVDQRIFFGQTANVTAEITEIAANIAEEQVDQTLRDKLKEVFLPRAAYSDRMAILPALDDIRLEDDRPTLIILERPADALPPDFVSWWEGQDLSMAAAALVLSLLDDKPILILAPATLIWQWQEELDDKLGLPAAVWSTQRKCWLDKERRPLTQRGDPELVARCPWRIGIVSTGLIINGDDAGERGTLAKKHSESSCSMRPTRRAPRGRPGTRSRPRGPTTYCGF